MRIMNFNLCLFLVTTILTVMVSGEDIPFWDIIPVTAQIKSLFQLIMGDSSGAKNTQVHFLNEGLGPAQARSVYFAVTGDLKKAINIQGKFLKNLEGILDGTPVVGHVKGGIHLLVGDHDHGWDAIKSATSTTGTILGGAVLGPIGAVGGHLLTDTAITVTDFALNGNNSNPHGILGYFKNIRNKTAGEHFDALAGLLVDGLAGGKVKSKTETFSAPQTIRQSSDVVRELSEGMSYKALMQAEAESSVLKEEQSLLEPFDDYDDPQDMRIIEQGLPAEAEGTRDVRIESPDKSVASPDMREQSPDIREQSPDIREQSPDIREQSPDIREQSSDIREQSPEISIKSTYMRAASVPDILVAPSDKRVASTNSRRASAPAVLEQSSDRDGSSGTWVESDSPDLRAASPMSMNMMKSKSFWDFLRNDPNYAKFNLARFAFKELDTNGFSLKNIFSHKFEHFFLDVELLRNRLSYLTDEEKSLITKHDFRSVNKDIAKTDSMMSSLAGILHEDVETFQKRLSKEPKNAYNPVLDILPKSHLNELRKRKNLVYHSSNELLGLNELNGYLMTHYRFLEGKKMILTETVGTEEFNAVVLKIKKVKGNPDPVKLMINYQVPGFVQRGLPNPFRFTTHLENPNRSFKIHIIGIQKNTFNAYGIEMALSSVF